jgi:hypothetical protein
MALDPRALSKVIEIINKREKEGGDPPKKKSGGQITAYEGGKEKTPTGRTNEFSYSGGLNDYMKVAQARGLDISNLKSAGDLQGRIYDSLMSSQQGQDVLRGMWKDFGDTRAGSGQVLPQNLSAQDLAGLRSSFADDKLGGRTQMVLDMLKPRTIPQRPPEEIPDEYVDPNTGFTIGGRTAKGVGTTYFPKSYEDWNAIINSGIQWSNTERSGVNPTHHSQATTGYSPGDMLDAIKRNPELMAKLGDPYINDPESKPGKNQMIKLKDAENRWIEGARQNLIKNGFKGAELEKAIQNQMSYNPYRTNW